ncbi:MAG: exodeoxyribonuclease VII large subunit [Lachnospiraceae bacterium]|nr:exodeoxyribonuclease VII large subunit [Lachnospiraceae bacterium]
MAAIYSVTQINQYIKMTFTNDYLLRDVQVAGEVSNVKKDGRGNIYFTMKDAGAALSGVMFSRDAYYGLGFDMRDGQRVIVSGYISFFERDGKCQIYARKINLEGRGNLYEEYERLKERLYEEGLFDFEHKKPIPKFPKSVGIVTAKTGAAIQDICNIARRRNPYVQLVLYPSKVQGEGAAATIAEGIKVLDRMNLDTIIVGRGGGSIEDLWAFNEEIVARAIYEAVTPVISGTGHEIDNTIADYVADLRAPTPSAACELAIPDMMAVLRQLQAVEDTMKHNMDVRFQGQNQRFKMLQIALDRVSPKAQYEHQKRQVESFCESLLKAMKEKYNQKSHRYDVLVTKLNGLSPTAKLTGGYGYIADRENNPVKSVDDLREQDTFSVTIWDGKVEGTVRKIYKDLEIGHG